ncbi:MAG: PorT family protein [Cytophagaceae bacterium]|nr:PorT family protein [Cytophagaceae bacterium]
MQKSLAILIALLLLAAPSWAQKRRSAFAFGVKGGLNLSQLKTGDFFTARLGDNGVPRFNYNGQVLKDNLRESYDSRTGLAGGVWMRFGRTLYLQPEAVISSKGGAFEVYYNGQNVSNLVKVKLTTIDVPVLIGLKLGPLRVNAGPMASFVVNNNQTLGNALSQYTTGSIDDAFQKAFYGYQLGGGLDIGSWSLDVRYEGSLSDVSSLNLQSVAGSTQFNQKNNLWQVTVGHKLF